MQLLSSLTPASPPATLRLVTAKQDRTYAEALGKICSQVYPTAQVQSYRRACNVLASLRTEPADFLLVGLSFPDMDGLELLERVGEENLAHHVIVLAETRDELLIPALQTARVDAIIDTGLEPLDAIGEALSRVKDGQVYISPSLHGFLVRRGPARAIRADLTPSELRVLRIIGTGEDNQEAARILGLSVSTVQTHRRNIMQKLKVPTSAKLVREAIRLGLAHITYSTASSEVMPQS